MALQPLPGPRGIAQISAMRQLLAEPAQCLDELSAAYGPVIGLGGGPQRLAIIGDPNLLQALWSERNESFVWGHRFNVLGFVVGKESMIVSDGPEHRRRRGAVQHAFTIRRLEQWIPMIVDATDQAIDALLARHAGSAVPVDLYPLGRDLVLRIAVRALFGERLAGRADELGQLFERPQAYLEAPAWRQLPHPFPRTARARVRADRVALDKIIDGEIAFQRAQPSSDGEGLLATLVAEGELTDSEIRDQVVSLIGAGFHTTAASLAWMLCRATAEPTIWHAVQSEADEVLGHTATGQLVNSHLSALTTASAVMHESLRLHPAGLISPRQAAVNLDLGPYTIKRGTMILWSPYLAGRDAQTWADPSSFDPGRFQAPTAEQQAVIRRGWVPFGQGPRRCIGFALAQMELTLIVARLAQRIDANFADTAGPRPVGMVVNRPSGGAPVRLSARPAVSPR